MLHDGVLAFVARKQRADINVVGKLLFKGLDFAFRKVDVDPVPAALVQKQRVAHVGGRKCSGVNVKATIDAHLLREPCNHEVLAELGKGEIDMAELLATESDFFPVLEQAKRSAAQPRQKLSGQFFR